MKKKSVREENQVQAEAFLRMQGDELELISQYAADFRGIITDFEGSHEGQVPSADYLLNVESRILGHAVPEE